MPYSAPQVSTTFTPAEDMTIEVSITYDGAGNGSSFGQVRRTHIYVTQNATTTYSPGQAIPISDWGSYEIKHQFPVVAGLPVELGLVGFYSGAVSISWRRVAVTARRVA